MIPDFSKVHNKFKINGSSFDHDQLLDVGYSFIKEGEEDERALGIFLLDWLDDKDYIVVPTSGSTGVPKSLKLKKQAMVNSAIATGDYFGLEPGCSALHCLPVHYIAGKMMFVRALMLGLELDLVTPTVAPLDVLLREYDFCAMTPMQLKNSLFDVHKIKTLIVGGAPVSQALRRAIQDKPTKIFAAYGMTETVSHIAVKPLNHVAEGEFAHYRTLPEIHISTDDRGCLVIEAPKILDEKLVTNDIVQLHSDTEFEFLGRIDNIINSGGVKLYPESIEEKLYGRIDRRFFIASEADDTLGDKLILVLEGEGNDLESNVFEVLDKYEVPKEVYAVPAFKETRTHKINRKKTLELLKK